MIRIFLAVVAILMGNFAVDVGLAHGTPAGSRGWLALGDSYSSGEGIPGTPSREAEGSGLATQGRDCRRATGDETKATAWSVSAYRETVVDFGFEKIALVACTAAVSSQLESQIGEARARFGLSSWDLVTLSIGGNDIRFAEVLKGCLDLNLLWGAFDLTPGCDITEQELRASIEELRNALARTYDLVANVVSSGGDVIVVGYPQLVEEVARWDRWRRNIVSNCEGIQRHDVGMLRSVGGFLNEQLATAALEADARHRDQGVRFHFLDISKDAYESGDRPADRHALCSSTPWLNGQTLGITSGDWWELDRSFHPNQKGHDATGEVLVRKIRSDVRLDDASESLADRVRAGSVVDPERYQFRGEHEELSADIRYFSSPSGNITCSIGIRQKPVTFCYLMERADPPPTPSDCRTGNPGWVPNYVTLTQEGVADGACAGGYEFPDQTTVLPYGSSLIFGEFGCLSELTGLTCVHFPTERGFTAARSGVKKV